jgi:hypothetical protein
LPKSIIRAMSIPPSSGRATRSETLGTARSVRSARTTRIQSCVPSATVRNTSQAAVRTVATEISAAAALDSERSLSPVVRLRPIYSVISPTAKSEARSRVPTDTTGCNFVSGFATPGATQLM